MSTVAPAAMSNSAFHAAAALPPATTARLPASAKNSGRRASASMRGGLASDGVRLMHYPLQFRQAGAAIGAGAQGFADRLNVGCLFRPDGRANDVEANAETGADHRADFGEAVGGPAGQQHAALHVAERVDLEQRLRRVPLRCGFGGTDEQAAFETAGAERGCTIDAARNVEKFGDLGAEHQIASVLAPELRPFFRSYQITDAACERDARPPGLYRQPGRLARQYEAAIPEFNRFDARRGRFRLGLAGIGIGVRRDKVADTRG